MSATWKKIGLFYPPKGKMSMKISFFIEFCPKIRECSAFFVHIAPNFPLKIPIAPQSKNICPSCTVYPAPFSGLRPPFPPPDPPPQAPCLPPFLSLRTSAHTGVATPYRNGTTPTVILSVVLRAANQNHDDCQWQSYYHSCEAESKDLSVTGLSMLAQIPRLRSG